MSGSGWAKLHQLDIGSRIWFNASDIDLLWLLDEKLSR